MRAALLADLLARSAAPSNIFSLFFNFFFFFFGAGGLLLFLDAFFLPFEGPFPLCPPAAFRMFNVSVIQVGSDCYGIVF